MSTPDALPPTDPTNTTTTTATMSNTSDEARIQARNAKIVYNISLSLTLLCPAIALMPPRKMDLFTLGLGLAWGQSAGYVVEAQTGHGLLWHIGTKLPSEANRRRRELERRREEVRRKEMGLGPVERGWLSRTFGTGRKWEGEGLVGEEAAEGEMTKEEEEERIVSKPWVRQRLKEEREALESGKGYGGLIADYIKEGLGLKFEDEDEEEKNA